MRRYRQHLANCRLNDQYASRWIRSLLDEGNCPVMQIIETVPAGQDWETVERKWIAHYRSQGARLTNATDGGDGSLGLPHSEESRRKISLALRGRKATPRELEMFARWRRSPEAREVLKRMQANRVGKPMPEETRRRIGNANRGRKRTAESIAKQVQKRIGTKHTPEAIEKIRLSHLGKKRSPEVCQAISKRRKGQSYGPHSDEWRKKISDGLLRAYRTGKRKRRVT